MYIPHIPPISALHINIKELAAVYAAVYSWAPLWTNRRVIVHTDSEVVMAIINKGTSTNSVCTTILKEMCFRSLQYNFSLFAVHIAGHENIIADSVSRFNTHGFIKTFISAIYHLYISHACIPPVYELSKHMTQWRYMFFCNLVICYVTCNIPIPTLDLGH